MNQELYHASRVRSKYAGGFYKVGIKAMNTSEYNHDYYIKNKEKWKRDKGGTSKIPGDEKKSTYDSIKLPGDMEIPNWLVRFFAAPFVEAAEFYDNYKKKMERKRAEDKALEPDEFKVSSFFDFTTFFKPAKYEKKKKQKSSIRHSAETQTSGGGRSRSKYAGGFILKGNRMNNTSEYNHDYYIKNKEKWNKNKKSNEDPKKLGSVFFIPTSWFNEIFVASVKTINAGFQFINNLFNTPKNEKPNTSDAKMNDTREKVKQAINRESNSHKYVYKITQPDGTYRYFYSDAEYNSYLSNLKRKTEGPDKIIDDINAINPGYLRNRERQYNDENCAYCTLAYDMRRRGYDVTAISENDKNFKPVYSDTIQSWYKGGDKAYTHHVADIKDNRVDTNNETHRLFSELASQGDGASGFVTCYWQSGGGHAMAYQVIDGEAVVIDTQCRRTWTEKEFAERIAPSCIWGYKGERNSMMDEYYQVSYMRTDNLEPTSKVSGIVKNADGATRYSYNDKIGKHDKVELVEKRKV